MTFIPFSSVPVESLTHAVNNPRPILRRDPTRPGYVPAPGKASLRVRFPALDAATLASQSAPRPLAGIGADLWDMFKDTHKP